MRILGLTSHTPIRVRRLDGQPGSQLGFWLDRVDLRKTLLLTANVADPGACMARCLIARRALRGTGRVQARDHHGSLCTGGSIRPTRRKRGNVLSRNQSNGRAPPMMMTKSGTMRQVPTVCTNGSS